MEVLVGTRVVRGPDWSWREQDGGDGYLGTVAEIQAPGPAGSSDERSRARIVTVQWDCGGRCRYRCGLGGKYDLRGFDSGPAGELWCFASNRSKLIYWVIHIGAFNLQVAVYHWLSCT